jgi:hypothetical protein
MNLFKKKLKIEFFSTVPGVSSVYPVIPAKNYMPNWVEKTKEHYKEINQVQLGYFLSHFL